MLAMQYGFTLPADYDMAVVRRRIAERGHLTDAFPGLAFKAYLHASRDGGLLPSAENLYAPFYLWDHNGGLNEFLAGEGFTQLTRAFGWPSVRWWSMWHVVLSSRLGQARYASRELLQLAPYAALGSRRRRESDAAEQSLGEGALAALVGFEPATWSLVRLRLWREPRPELAYADCQLYEVGHLSIPAEIPA